VNDDCNLRIDFPIVRFGIELIKFAVQESCFRIRLTYWLLFSISLMALVLRMP